MSSMSVHESSRVHCAVYVIKTRFQLRSRSHALLVGRSDVQQLERRLYITPCIFLTFTLSMYGPFSINIYIATSPSRLPRARCYLRPPTVMSKLNFGAKKRPSPAGTLYNFVWKGKWEYSNCLRINHILHFPSLHASLSSFSTISNPNRTVLSFCIHCAS